MIEPKTVEERLADLWVCFRAEKENTEDRFAYVLKHLDRIEAKMKHKPTLKFRSPFYWE